MNIVIDRSTILFDYRAILSFGEKVSLFLPLAVLEDLRDNPPKQGHKKKNCDEFLGLIGELSSQGDLFNGVTTARGATISIYTPKEESIKSIKSNFVKSRLDKVLFATAIELQDRGEVLLLTRDAVLQAKSSIWNIQVVFYKKSSFKAEELYPLFKIVEVERTLVEAIKNRENIKVEDESIPNEYIKVVCKDDSSFYSYGRYIEEKGVIAPLSAGSRGIPRWITPKNIEQSLALDALLDDDISLVTLIGKAGTGKTLLAIAAGLYKSLDESVYDRVLVSRPTLPMGQDIGFLPGSVEEKLAPWMYPISDNVDLILRNRKSARSRVQGFKDLTEMGVLLIEPLTYIRGRSIHNQYLIVDEAQNLSTHEIKTILTRAGEGTKIVLAGDPYQIDNPDIISTTSGLMQVVEKLKGNRETAHITFTKGERSKLAEIASDLL